MLMLRPAMNNLAAQLAHRIDRPPLRFIGLFHIAR